MGSGDLHCVWTNAEGQPLNKGKSSKQAEKTPAAQAKKQHAAVQHMHSACMRDVNTHAFFLFQVALVWHRAMSGATRKYKKKTKENEMHELISKKAGWAGAKQIKYFLHQQSRIRAHCSKKRGAEWSAEEQKSKRSKKHSLPCVPRWSPSWVLARPTVV
jgi:hypothetical protein